MKENKHSKSRQNTPNTTQNIYFRSALIRTKDSSSSSEVVFFICLAFSIVFFCNPFSSTCDLVTATFCVALSFLPVLPVVFKTAALLVHSWQTRLKVLPCCMSFWRPQVVKYMQLGALWDPGRGVEIGTLWSWGTWTLSRVDVPTKVLVLCRFPRPVDSRDMPLYIAGSTSLFARIWGGVWGVGTVIHPYVSEESCFKV